MIFQKTTLIIGVLAVSVCGILLIGNSIDSHVTGSNVSAKPNVIIVQIDDLGFHDISANGSKIYQTPNVDRFISDSYSFQNAYANYPRCLPSRFALITGTYPIKEFNSDLTTIKNENNFIKQFKESGYKSFYIGKWHIGEEEKNLPTGFGFDASFAANGAGGVGSHFYPFNTRDLVAPIGKVPPVPDVQEYGKVGDYLADVLTNRMIEYLNGYDLKAPFFTMLNYYAVHTPMEAKEEDIKRNAQQIENFDFGELPEYIEEGNGMTKMRQNDSVYAAMVENMDWNLGRLLKSIEENRLLENTIVIFTSDHGGLSNKGDRDRRLATSNYPLRAGKGHLYEGGIRIPLAIRWPKYIKPFQDTENIVALMDLMPTLLDFCNIDSLKTVDGKSFKNVISASDDWSERTLFFHEKMARPGFTGDFPCSTVRSGKYKLMHYFDQGRYELYDLSKDIMEENNIVEDEPIILNKMKSELQDWRAKHALNN